MLRGFLASKSRSKWRTCHKMTRIATHKKEVMPRWQRMSGFVMLKKNRF